MSSNEPSLTTASKINAAEIILRREIARPNASPFISHAKLDEPIAKSLRVGAADFVRGRPEVIARFIDLHPAAGAWLLVHGLAENYGKADDFAIYPRIAVNFGLAQSIPNQPRAELNQSFRRACQKLGLALAGYRPTGFVDDYVFQAGVARSQLEPMIDAFLHAEQVFGPAPDDDTQRLNAWEDQAAEFAHWTLLRLRNILRQDETAYHAQCFARARRKEAASEGFEELIAQALERSIASGKDRGGSFFSTPTLVFQDEALFIVAPLSESIIVPIAGRDRRISAGGRLALPTPWMPVISWKPTDAKPGAPAPQPIFVISGSRRLIAFDAETGRMLRGIADDSDKDPTPVNAKEIILIGTSAFEVGGERSLALGAQAFGLYVTLHTRTAVTIDGRNLFIVPPSRPLIDVDLPRIGRSAIGPLCGSPRSATVRFLGGRPDGQLELVAEHPACREPFQAVLAAGSELTIDLGDWLPRSGPAGLLKLVVKFAEFSRPLVRASLWVWPGLRGLAEGSQFDAPMLPPNLALNESRHIVRSTSGQIALALDESYRSAEIAFRLPDGSSTSFEIPRPGVSVALVSEDGSERFLGLGSVLAVGPDSTDSLIIRNTDNSAGLDVRGQLEPHAFGRSGLRRLPLAILASPARHDEVRLVPYNRPGAERVLVRVAPTTAPNEFRVEHQPHSSDLEITVKFRQRLDAVKLVVRDIASGTMIEAAVALGRWPVDIPHRGLLECVIEDASEPTLRIIVHPGALTLGFWIGEFLVRREGSERWSALVNARKDHYLIGIPLAIRFGAAIAHLERDKLFLRSSEELNRCVAAECWASYSGVVEHTWQKLGSEIAARLDSKHILLAAAALPLPIDASSTWIPLRHPIELAPDLFGAELRSFQVFDNVEIDGGTEIAIAARSANLKRLSDAMGEVLASVCFFQGYENFGVAARDPRVRLKGFSIKRYREALKQDDDQSGLYWRPRNGRLSAAHHSWCVRKFVDRVERVAPDNANSNGQRLPQAARIAYGAQNHARDCALDVPDMIVERLELTRVLPGLFSLAARASRNNDTKRFWEMVSASGNRPLPELLRDFGFLLRLAPELFGFYLLLWELVRRGDDQ